MVSKIVILGGGSAGWMTAAYMSQHLEGIDITLIESSDIPIVGVGESTIVPMVRFMQSLGLEEAEWMPAVHGTYKSAIRFTNFYKQGETFHYTFEPMQMVSGRPVNRYWHNEYLSGGGQSDRMAFYDYCFLTPEVLRRDGTMRSFMEAGPAYHLDAGLLGDYLARYSAERGVTRIIDTVRDVELDDNGNVRALVRASGERLEGDLFIDCSGFRAQLLDKTLNEPFEYYSDYLFNNKAVAIRYPYENPEKEMFSSTDCTALSSGWVWQVPLFHRMGSGYVYCDRYKSPDEAELEFRQFLGEERMRDIETRHIDIRVGKHRNVWVKNCIGIGLAGGFLEPLESTGVFSVQFQAETLTRMLEKGRNDYNAADVRVYNNVVTQFYEGVRDFLGAHYVLTSREDSAYWRDIKYGLKVSDRLAEILRYARLTFVDAPVINQFFRANFADYSFTDGWESVLIGMNHMPFDYGQFQGVGPFEPQIVQNMNNAAQFQAEKQRFIDEELPKHPTHYAYLREHIYADHEPEFVAKEHGFGG